VIDSFLEVVAISKVNKTASQKKGAKSPDKTHRHKRRLRAQVQFREIWPSVKSPSAWQGPYEQPIGGGCHEQPPLPNPQVLQHKPAD